MGETDNFRSIPPGKASGHSPIPSFGRTGSPCIKDFSSSMLGHQQTTALDWTLGHRLGSIDFGDSNRKVIVFIVFASGLNAVFSSARMGLMEAPRAADASTTPHQKQSWSLLAEFCLSHVIFGATMAQVVINNQCQKFVLDFHRQRSPGRHLARLAWRYLLAWIVLFDNYIIVRGSWKKSDDRIFFGDYTYLLTGLTSVVWSALMVLLSAVAMFPVDGIEEFFALP
ncbi:hypothetical protein T439DRAFT_329270 [Meredithblackwellia eburnea MCA 4105]